MGHRWFGSDLGGCTALDAFGGSGIVGYTLKAVGYEVTINDFLAFPCEIARAAIENDEVTLDDLDLLVRQALTTWFF